MQRVFISYSRKDIEFVRRLARDLENAGLVVWWDILGIPPGSEWPKRIQDGLENSTSCLVVLSPDAIQSPWVRKEYTFAESENKPIIPLYYRHCKMPIALTDLNYINFTLDYEVALSQLSNTFGVQFQQERSRQEKEKDHRVALPAIKRVQEERTTNAIEKPDSLTRERTKAFENSRKRVTWPFNTRQLVNGVIGAVLYGVLSHVTNIFPLLAVDRIIFRPAVAVLIFFGAAYGPWVGLITGLIGNTIGDELSFGRPFWNWSIGHGLMGMMPGLKMAELNNFRARADIVKAVVRGVFGIIVGMLFASLSEMFIGGIDLKTALTGYFAPAFIGNSIIIIVLLPILMITFAGVATRRND